MRIRIAPPALLEWVGRASAARGPWRLVPRRGGGKRRCASPNRSIANCTRMACRAGGAIALKRWISAQFRHICRVVGLVGYEHMFATLDGTVDQALERRREARRARGARDRASSRRVSTQRVTEIVREADDEGDWQAAGCSSSAQWLAQVSSSDYRTAERITRTSEALRSLPALDQALSTGALTLDQVAAAAEFATPESDAELARVAVGKAPSAIALAARTLAPPAVADDQALYERRALSMTWTRGRRELVFSGRLPLEQGAAFEQAIWNIAKPQRAADKQAGTVLEWQQSTADALVTLARARRRETAACGAAPPP